MGHNGPKGGPFQPRRNEAHSLSVEPPPVGSERATRPTQRRTSCITEGQDNGTGLPAIGHPTRLNQTPLASRAVH